jgi:hypothetical protein
MASKDTNSTIWTVAIIVGIAFAGWWFFIRGKKSPAQGNNGVTNAAPNYYPPNYPGTGGGSGGGGLSAGLGSGGGQNNPNLGGSGLGSDPLSPINALGVDSTLLPGLLPQGVSAFNDSAAAYADNWGEGSQGAVGFDDLFDTSDLGNALSQLADQIVGWAGLGTGYGPAGSYGPSPFSPNASDNTPSPFAETAGDVASADATPGAYITSTSDGSSDSATVADDSGYDASSTISQDVDSGDYEVADNTGGDTYDGGDDDGE